MSHPFDGIDTLALLARKDALVDDLIALAARLGLEPDYSYVMMASARALPDADRIALLEALVEIEAVKYTLAARRVRELDPEGTR